MSAHQVGEAAFYGDLPSDVEVGFCHVGVRHLRRRRVDRRRRGERRHEAVVRVLDALGRNGRVLSRRRDLEEAVAREPGSPESVVRGCDGGAADVDPVGHLEGELGKSGEVSGALRREGSGAVRDDCVGGGD